MTVFQTAVAPPAVVVRVTGMANMKVTPNLDRWLRPFFEPANKRDAMDRVIFDLSGCTGMDSTFMGFLVGLQGQLGDDPHNVAIIRPDVKSRRLLSMLGVDAVVPVVDNADVDELHYSEVPDSGSISVVETSRLVRQAHQDLAALSEENCAKFAPVLKALDEDINRLLGK